MAKFPPGWRRLLASVALGGLAVTTASIWVPRRAVAYATAQAAKRGVVLRADRARVGWLRVFLENADAKLDGVDGVDVRFAELRVDLDYRLGIARLYGRGGRAAVVDRGHLREELSAWKERRRGTGSAPSNVTTPAEMDLDEVEAVSAGGVKFHALGAKVERERDRTELNVVSIDAELEHVTLKAGTTNILFEEPGMTLRSAHAVTGDFALAYPPSTETAMKVTAVPSDLPPAVAPLPKGNRRGKSSRPKESSEPLPTILPDLHVLRANLAAAIASAAARIPGGSTIDVDALSVRVQKGEDEMVLGSGRLEVGRDDDRINLSFMTSPLARSTPLALHGTFPTGQGDIEISASGGPVPLGLLGMHGGGFLHLIDVDRTNFAGRGRIVLDDTGQNLTFDVEGSVRGLSLQDTRLAHDPVRGMDLGVAARGLIDDKGELRLDGAEASVGAVRGTLHGGLAQTPEHFAASFDFDFPTASCEALLTSVPTALIPTVSTARMDGTFGLRGRLALDTSNLESMTFDFDVLDRCRLVEVPSELDRKRFSGSFTHVVYTRTGDLEEQTTGPGTSNWSDLDEISPYMQVAVLTTEDGAFYHHHGFNHTAIRQAVVANVKARRFVRGASTITMQLAKNLFLTRDKTLARKLEELVLADYLEQAFTKDEMMELYLNIIEFGPDVYGVRAAAGHYFGRTPSELNLAECLFLSSILPNPIAFHKVSENRQLGEGWMKMIRAHMDVAARSGFISATELAEGLREEVLFHHETDPPETPRSPVSTPTHPASAGEDWQELN